MDQSNRHKSNSHNSNRLNGQELLISLLDIADFKTRIEHLNNKLDKFSTFLQNIEVSVNNKKSDAGRQKIKSVISGITQTRNTIAGRIEELQSRTTWDTATYLFTTPNEDYASIIAKLDIELADINTEMEGELQVQKILDIIFECQRRDILRYRKNFTTIRSYISTRIINLQIKYNRLASEKSHYEEHQTFSNIPSNIWTGSQFEVADKPGDYNLYNRVLNIAHIQYELHLLRHTHFKKTSGKTLRYSHKYRKLRLQMLASLKDKYLQ